MLALQRANKCLASVRLLGLFSLILLCCESISVRVANASQLEPAGTVSQTTGLQSEPEPSSSTKVGLTAIDDVAEKPNPAATELLSSNQLEQIDLGQFVENSSVSAPETPVPTWLNLRTNMLLGTVLVTLGIASLVGQYLQRQPSESINPALVRRFRQRLSAWWLMCAILVFGFLLQKVGTVILFGLVSFWALREFITMAPTRRGDHRALFWALVIFTPLQYVLVGLGRSSLTWPNGTAIDFYGLHSIMIPVYASLFIPARIALAGDHKRFLERSAQIQLGLLICVYSLSYAPAILDLNLKRSDGSSWTGSPAGLLFFFILLTQLSEVFQWAWGQLVGSKLIAKDVSTSRTWEGFMGGTLLTGLVGAMLCWVTPFKIWEAACISMIVAVMGMFGGMTMSAIKRDRGVNDYGSLVIGHAGVLDRIDSLCFAAPVFYHLTRFFFS